MLAEATGKGEGITFAEIAKKLGISQSRTTHLVQQLESQGLVAVSTLRGADGPRKKTHGVANGSSPVPPNGIRSRPTDGCPRDPTLILGLVFVAFMRDLDQHEPLVERLHDQLIPSVHSHMLLEILREVRAQVVSGELADLGVSTEAWRLAAQGGLNRLVARGRPGVAPAAVALESLEIGHDYEAGPISAQVRQAPLERHFGAAVVAVCRFAGTESRARRGLDVGDDGFSGSLFHCNWLSGGTWLSSP